MKRTFVLCAIALFTVSAMAQNKPAAKHKPSAEQPQAQAGMPMLKPAPEMLKLTKTLAGTWTTIVKTEAMGNMPATESKGEATFYEGPGGLSLLEDFRSEGGMGSFRGHGATYWDAKAGNYSGFWCDSMSPTGCAPGGTSNWEGDKIVGFMEMPDETGNMMKYRMTYSDIKPDSVTFTMEMPDGDDYKPMMTILYKRTGTTPVKPAAKKD